MVVNISQYFQENLTRHLPDIARNEAILSVGGKLPQTETVETCPPELFQRRRKTFEIWKSYSLKGSKT